MKKIILSIMLLIITIPFCIGDVEMNVTLIVDGDINTTIAQIAEGNIETTVYCNGETCTTNVFGGDIEIPENQSFNYIQYESYQKIVNERGGGGGLSFEELLYKLGSTMSEYTTDFVSKLIPARKSSAWDFWAMLDEMFVNHYEYEPTKNNVNYLAEEIDWLKAENQYLRAVIESDTPDFFDNKAIECFAGINKAKRTGQRVTTENGQMIDIEVFGEQCITLKNGGIHTPEINETEWEQPQGGGLK